MGGKTLSVIGNADSSHGDNSFMRISKNLRRKVRHDSPGVQVDGDVQIVIAGNVGESNSRTTSTSHQSIVSDTDRTVESGPDDPTEGGDQ